MSTTIERIQAALPSMQSNYDEYDVKTRILLKTAGSVFSGRSEYTPTIHEELLQEIIELFEAIVSNPTLFIQEFSSSERSAIAEFAEDLGNGNEDYDSPEDYLDSDGFKPLISRMRIIFGKKDALQYKVGVKRLQELMAKVNDMLSKKEYYDSLLETIEKISSRRDSITRRSLEIRHELKSIRDQSVMVEGILKNVKDIQEKKPTIDEFFNAINLNQEKLEKLDTQTTTFFDHTRKNNEDHAKQRQEDYENYTAQEAKILKQAEDMLGVSNAAGLATAFTKRIEEEEGRRKWWLLWILGAGTSIALAIIIATDVVPWHEIIGLNASFGNVLTRLPITSMLLLVAWFCGSQYLKSERTLEDYQYKKVLAQSMPAFMKQLERNNKEQQAYLLSVFDQMLQDPLRKKHDVSSPLKHFIDKVFSKLLNDTKKPSKTDTENTDDTEKPQK